MNRPRTLIVLPTLGPGGAERVTSLLASAWVQSGHAVRIVAWGKEDNSAFVPDAGVDVVTLDMLRPSRGLIDGIRGTRERFGAISKQIETWKPSVVLGMTTHAAILSSLAADGTGVPAIIAERNYPGHRPIGSAWEFLRRRAYARAKCVVMQTDRAAKWARRYATKEIRIIANPIAPAFLTPLVTDEREHRIVVVGRLIEGKRPDVALAVFAQLAERHPEWTLDFVGDGPLRSQVEADARRMGLDARVRFFGVVPQVPALLRSASIALFTSRSEGFPNAILEAIASGCAVVSSDCEAGPAEILGDTFGMLTPVGDVHRAAEAVESLITNADKRAQLGQRARQRAEEFSLERVLEQWRPLIEVEQ